MQCKFCKNETELVHVETKHAYCNEDCFELHTNYTEWKVRENYHGKKKSIHRESFDDIIARTGGYPVNSAHRGGGFSFGPENTMYAFKKSVASGARLLELDLRLTKDRELVILHWSTVDETTNGTGHVSDFTLADLRRLDAAYHNEELRGTGIQIPTFKEFLDEFAPVEDLLFFLDYKDSLSFKMSMKMIRAYNIANRFALGSVVSSTNSLLLKYREKHPLVPVCSDIIQTTKIISAYYLGLLGLYTYEHDIIGFVLCKATAMFWGKGLIDAIHEGGCRVVVSGYGEELNKPERLKQCIAFGVDYIMCDKPDLLQRLLEERDHLLGSS